MDLGSKQKFTSDFRRYSVKYFFLVAFFAGVIAFSVNLIVETTKPSRFLISPLPAQEYFSAGFQANIADLLWLRAVQDMDYCEQLIAKNICVNNGWLFQMLDSITNLAADFRMPFAVGPLSLSVIVNDIRGASKIFDKAVLAFPADWKILSRAAYHALYEENDRKKAALLYLKASQNGAPEWMYALASTLFLQTGQSKMVKEILAEIKTNAELSDEIKTRIEEKLKNISN
jgi:hypothetical protein